ncbi:hypothetical protein [Thalassotalea litorea]|uniref:hypothetical protein n=1 Tax=Thalassotalea litorea TaxID=2020715 RepID=UPI003735B4D1
MTKKRESTQFNWIHKMVRRSRCPWGNGDKPDDFRICWYLDEENKQAIYEYRNHVGGTNGFAITGLLQEQLPEHINRKYFLPEERAWVFGFFFSEICQFIEHNVDDLAFFNFTGVSKSVFFSSDNYESLLTLCENSV